MLDYIMTVTDERGYVIQQETVQADDIHEAVDFLKGELYVAIEPIQDTL